MLDCQYFPIVFNTTSLKMSSTLSLIYRLCQKKPKKKHCHQNIINKHNWRKLSDSSQQSDFYNQLKSICFPNSVTKNLHNWWTHFIKILDNWFWTESCFKLLRHFIKKKAKIYIFLFQKLRKSEKAFHKVLNKAGYKI